MTRTHLTYSADEIVAAVTETHGNVRRAAARLGMSEHNLRGHAARRGLDVPALRQQILASESPAPVPETPDDALPSTQPLLAAAFVDLAAMGIVLQETQAELQQRDHIIATLTRELESRAA